MHISQIEEFKKCYEDFTYFLSKYVKICHPLRGWINFDVHPYQKRLWETYDDKRFVILTKFRKGGFTTLTCLWALYQCMFKLDKRVMIACKRMSDAADIKNRLIKPVLQFLPEWMRPTLGTNNQNHMEFKDTNSHLHFSNMEAARGCRLDCLIIDEAAFHKKLEQNWKAYYPCLSCGGQCFVLSTTNGIGNWFQETYHNAQEGKNAFHIFFADYKEHPDWQSEKWASDQKVALGEKGWAQEVLQCFLLDNGYDESSISTQPNSGSNS